MSLSARRAWIEIGQSAQICATIASLSARRAWIEIELPVLERKITRSLSARCTWIEISLVRRSFLPVFVALRKESVDRNPRWSDASGLTPIVALRKESVDRNAPV